MQETVLADILPVLNSTGSLFHATYSPVNLRPLQDRIKKLQVPRTKFAERTAHSWHSVILIDSKH